MMFLKFLIAVWSIPVTCLILYFIRVYFQGAQYKKNNRIDGKVIIITGCNTGIGKETALELAKRGGKIYMACRDEKRCEDARSEIIEKSGNRNVFNRTLDLSSFESIRNFVIRFKKEESRLDVLINNAGVAVKRRTLTKDGFEMQFGVNHLGHFLLTNLLLDRLKESSPSRIVVVSSITYIIGKIKKDDLNSNNSYHPFRTYSSSKLANILFTRHLSKKLAGTGVVVNSLHPGIVRTEISRHFKFGFLRLLYTPFVWLFFKTARSGAQTTIKLAIDPELKDTTGKFYNDSMTKLITKQARDEKLADWLWTKSEELTGLSDKI